MYSSRMDGMKMGKNSCLLHHTMLGCKKDDFLFGRGYKGIRNSYEANTSATACYRMGSAFDGIHYEQSLSSCGTIPTSHCKGLHHFEACSHQYFQMIPNLEDIKLTN